MTGKAWERAELERARWFARFEAYRLLGPARSLEGAFQAIAEAGQATALTAQRPGQAWYEAARRWEWQSRAEAWDEERRARVRAAEENRRIDAREQRIAMIDAVLNSVFEILHITDLRNPSPELARTLPTIRILFKDLLSAERAEIGMPTFAQAETQSAVTLTADALFSCTALNLTASENTGTSTLTLTATQANGASATDRVQITIQPLHAGLAAALAFAGL